jgi:hypothetical protein
MVGDVGGILDRIFKPRWIETYPTHRVGLQLPWKPNNVGTTFRSMHLTLDVGHYQGCGTVLGAGFYARASGRATGLTVYPRRQIRLT